MIRRFRWGLSARHLAAVLGAAACLLLAGCSHYADFALPPAGNGDVRATFRFEARPEPVLTRGDAAAFDSHDALNPSVVRTPSGLLNFYSGFDGSTWRTGLAASQDGIAWSKQGAVFSPQGPWEHGYIAANGTVVWHEGEFWHWYQAGPKDSPRIGLARSRDGRAWTRHASPVLGYGPRSSWDERALGDPYVVRAGGWFYLYYLGQDRARRQRLGVARSRDGVHWEKLRRNPILELGSPGSFDEVGLGEPAVWQSHGWYWMLYTGRDAGEQRRLGLARSSDGVHWTKQPLVISGEGAWDGKVVCDPSVEVGDGDVRVWFGGGSVASPDENLNGQIGYGVLRATLAK